MQAVQFQRVQAENGEGDGRERNIPEVRQVRRKRRIERGNIEQVGNGQVDAAKVQVQGAQGTQAPQVDGPGQIGEREVQEVGVRKQGEIRNGERDRSEDERTGPHIDLKSGDGKIEVPDRDEVADIEVVRS